MILGLRPRLLLAFGLAQAALAAAGLATWRNATATIRNHRAAVESEQTLQLLEDIRDEVAAADNAARDYLYADDPDTLPVFDSSTARLDALLAQLRRLTRSEPEEHAAAESLATLVNGRTAFVIATIEASRGPGGDTAALALIRSGRGWGLSDAIQHLLETGRTAERHELLQRGAALDRSARRARSLVAIAVLVTILVVALVSLRIVGEITERNLAQHALAAREALLRDAYDELTDLYDHAPCGYHSLDPDGLIVRMNATELRWLGYTRDEVLGRMHITAIVGRSGAQLFRERMERLDQDGAIHAEVEYVRKDGTSYPALMSATAVRDDAGNVVMTRTVATDLSDLRRAQVEARRAGTELVHAMDHLRELSGLLPICAWCKKIRDDRGYWNSVEEYVSAHSDAVFSHGLCPDCAPKAFPELRQTVLGASAGVP